MTDTPLSDFPKLHCPFIRQTFPVDRGLFRQEGSKYGLRGPEVYLVVDQVNPGYEWVFEDPTVFAVEKLNGTNIKLLTEKGRLTALQNRKNIIDPLQILSGKTFIVEGIFRSIGKGYVKPDGEQAGELIGPKLQGNPYKMDFHEWIPFEKSETDLRYKSFHEHERNFANWSSWFRDFLHSRFYQKRAAKTGATDKVFAEGVVFYSPARRAEGKTWMAKLRRDMFDWFYPDLKVSGYDPRGRDEAEDQEKFD